MAEADNPLVRITPSGSTELNTPQNMDFFKASEVLAFIVQTPEDALTSKSSFETIGTYTGDQLRAAMAYMIQALHQDLPDQNYGRFGVRKQVAPDSYLSLLLTPHVSTLIKSRGGKGFGLIMSLVGKTAPTSFEFPITAESQELDQHDTLFMHEGRIVRLSDLAGTPNEEDVRFMWRGLRWMSANILGWRNNGVIEVANVGSAPTDTADGPKPPLGDTLGRYLDSLGKSSEGKKG